MSVCPCGSALGYLACCGQYIESKKFPETPEQLMRSRYSAYTLACIPYIKKTMRGKALLGFQAKEARGWAKRVVWLGLRVQNAYFEHPDKGFVEFIARFREGVEEKSIHEISEFQRVKGGWFYVDGRSPS